MHIDPQGTTPGLGKNPDGWKDLREDDNRTNAALASLKTSPTARKFLYAVQKLADRLEVLYGTNKFGGKGSPSRLGGTASYPGKVLIDTRLSPEELALTLFHELLHKAFSSGSPCVPKLFPNADSLTRMSAQHAFIYAMEARIFTEMSKEWTEEQTSRIQGQKGSGT